MKHNTVTDEHLQQLGSMLESQSKRGMMSRDFALYSLVNYYHNRVGVKGLETIRVGLSSLKGQGLRINIGFLALMAGSIWTKNIKRIL